MATNLVTLPDEILSHIFGYIDVSKAKRCNLPYRRTICALARTNRQLSNIARGLLYCHIVFDVDEAHLAPWAPQPSFVSKFLRTCRERPDLLHSIQHLDITWSLDQDEDDILEALLRQLAKSTSLTHLRLDIEEIDFELSVSPCALRPLLQRNQSFLHLQILELISHDDVYMPAEFLYSLASLPSLRTLRVCCVISGPEDQAFRTSPQDTDFGQSLDLKDQLFELETLGVAQSIPNDVLELILSRCPGLKQLSALPITNDFCPTQLPTSLLPARTTLQSLSLSGEQFDVSAWLNTVSPLHDSPPFHFSPFTSLTHLAISVTLLCPSRLETLAPDTLRFIFPTSLEHLEFHLEYPQGIFWSAIASRIGRIPLTKVEFTSLFTNTLTHDSASVRAGLGCYLSLLSARKNSLLQSPPHNTSQFESDAHKKSVLPNLRSLRVVELGDSSETWSNLEYVGCGFYPEIFWDLRVDFEVMLRIPRGWRVPEA